MKKTDLWEMGDRVGEPYNCSNLKPRKSFQSGHRWRSTGGAWQSPWVEKTEMGAWVVKTWLDFAGRVLERRELHKEKILDICRGFFSSIQLTNDQHMHVMKYPRLSKKAPERIRGKIPWARVKTTHNVQSFD